MKLLKQNGYTHNPHSLRDTFKTTPDEVPESFLRVIWPILAALVVIALAILAIEYGYQQKRLASAAYACTGVEYQDKHGNTICADAGQNLGRGIKSNWVAK